MQEWKHLIHKLDTEHQLKTDEWVYLFRSRTEEVAEYTSSLARKRSIEQFGHGIYTRGLIELSNYCRNNCYYCGIRRDHKELERYRLSKEEILECAKSGWQLGFRTFVLQGGEDAYYTDAVMTDIIFSLKSLYPDCAITLSLGERSDESYRLMREAGADRYLLRHETADKCHYERLHPKEMDFDHRMKCLASLRRNGYQVGCGFMVGSPYQTPETLATDFQLITEFQPEMVGIGPFVPHHATPFAGEKPGSVEETLYLLSLLRILQPKLLLPATTALGTMDPEGRERGILSGANVLMPNLSPGNVRKKYDLYDNKLCTNEEAAEYRALLEKKINAIGYELLVDRGDSPI